jgi:MscS family membrane protein
MRRGCPRLGRSVDWRLRAPSSWRPAEDAEMLGSSERPMIDTLVRALATRAALLALLAIATAPALAQDPMLLQRATEAASEDAAGDATEKSEVPDGVDLSSPRATFRTFFDAMASYARQRDRAARERAVTCFDLSANPSLREEIGWKSARNLKNFIDRVRIVDLDELPDEVEGDYWLFDSWPQGEISLTRTSDGRWLFSSSTVDQLDALFESVRTEQVLEGIEGGGGAPQKLADVIRGQLPDAMLERSFLLENWQWLGLVLIALIGVIVERIVSSFVLRWLHQALHARTSVISGGTVAAFQKPLGIFAMAVVWTLLIGFLDLPVAALRILYVATRLVMGVSGVWAVYKLVDVGAAYFSEKAKATDTKMDDLLVPIFRRALKVAVMAFGVLFVAQNLDVDITSLLAGLSLGGLAVAFAAKDTVANLFGSVTVLVDKPFQIGDWVHIDGLDGTVVDVGLRSTRIRTFYNSVITVPNSRLVTAAVDNYGAREFRRIKTMISVQYDTPAETIEAFCEGIRELVRRHPYTRKDYYMVYFNEFAASSLDIMLYCFVKTPDWPTELRERHRLLLDVVRLAERLGVEFAFPTQTLHLASVPSVLRGADPPAEVPSEQTSPRLASGEEAIRLGRAEAEAIVQSSWQPEIQPPVQVTDPDRSPPR